ncbi:ATP-binding cassette domain-containing protein [Acetobacter cerevisiae]|uniref:ATP-binding cassette domain-containing protein n=1 Tax=Acetobacter cerevisiae TaxID=178900 RepID=A0ABT1ERL9_9PROT|nr:ATP-binding cassette domain-containing protein [Acetobacter cerevisiae]MCP1244600.1 ATP-binding cassette domain-containing protein [Acetobacter cerevisiae]MCP1254177.1 ATP-binding cassette domain-containing protein [Acetobacter cerevisiae]
MSVQVEHLVRYAPGSTQRLLNDVSLDVPTGAFVALVGPSGAGKTTLLRAIAGLDTFEQGTLLLDGQTMGTMRDRARKIGFVFQNYALFPHMTVAKNIAFGLDVLPRSERPSRSAIAARVQELLDLMQIPDAGASYPARLSGGQRQRVALARALATGPKLLLLDEPFGALDPIVRRSIRTWLKALHERLGLTTILVTHDQDEAVEIADRIVVMQHGQIVQDATPEDLNRNPQTAFVMEFLGEAPSFNGVVQDSLMIPDEAGLLPFAVNASVSPGPITAMLRPYEIQICSPDERSAQEPALSLIAEGSRNGYRHYRAQLAERSVPFSIPDCTENTVEIQASGFLDISRARLFRDGERCG